MSIRVPDFTSARILVVGDLMLDRYWSGHAGRVSPEAPVPVVNIDQVEDRLGGAANVAANIKTLGAQVGLLGIIGNDEPGTALQKLLAELEIKSYCNPINNVKTITKLRVLSQSQQMLRCDFEEHFSVEASKNLEQSFVEVISDYDVIVFSDYAKGSLQNVNELIALAKNNAKTVIVDPKGRNFKPYKFADVITPNQNEFELIAGVSNSHEDFVSRAKKLRADLQIENLLITRGEHGMFLQTTSENYNVKAVARDVHDVTGAGDTVVAVLAAAIAAGRSIASSMELANEAAGVVVAKVGTSTLTVHELRQALHVRGIGGRSLQSQEQIKILIKSLQTQNKKIVMTNGCFDILHSGHIAFLEEAKAQGDYLLVAVNDDTSVKRLKGPERPVNKISDRMAVIAALSAVDWVLAFSEDTPRDLIANILPNILVKGGDYEVKDIAGGTEVIAAGGEVRVLNFHAGRSTTRIIDQIRKSN